MNPGTLYFIPVTLGNTHIQKVLPAEVIALVKSLDTFIVENEKTSRQFLSALQHPTLIREITFQTLNEHTADKDLAALLNSLLQGKNVGLMSEAGCPGIADPGAKLAALAHQKKIRVAPLVGPSSILLSLMASGLNGQRFTFLGYLPSDKAARIQSIKELERRVKTHHETQIFIETPYRNQHLLDDIIATCHEDTKLCIACNISHENEFILTQPIRAWKTSQRPDLHKQPTVFLLGL